MSVNFCINVGHESAQVANAGCSNGFRVRSAITVLIDCQGMFNAVTYV